MVNFKAFAAAFTLFSLPVTTFAAFSDADFPFIENKYLVKLKSDISINATLPLLRLAISVDPLKTITMGDDFKVLLLDIPSVLVGVVRALPFVEYVEQDRKIRSLALTSQSNAPWGLGRISARSRGATSYVYDDSAGAGTVSYILDTGIRTSHSEFEGRASFGANLIGGPSGDCQGHGTHVAGTVGGKTYGVAKKTSLVDVQVLGCDGGGTTSSLVDGMAWAVNNAKRRGVIGRAVLNASWGGPYQQVINDAAASVQQNGVFMAVAAGNENQDARRVSPASAPLVCVVGATGRDDARASFSNYGPAVDIFAPGVDIISSSNTGGTVSYSGTSMATPHIVGLAAYVLAIEGTSVSNLCARLQGIASREIVTSANGAANYLAYNGNGR
jgi:subtilisin family serine protease